MKIKLADRTEINKTATVTSKQRGLVAMMMTQIFFDRPDEERRRVQQYLLGTESLANMSDSQIKAMLEWLEPKADDGGEFKPSSLATKEAKLVLGEVLANPEPEQEPAID